MKSKANFTYRIIKDSFDLKDLEKASQGQIGGYKTQLSFMRKILQKLFDREISNFQRSILL